MSTRFFCNSDNCTRGDNGPFVLELAQEAVLDGNNMATIFCPRCANAMKPLPQEEPLPDSQRFYCHSETCGHGEDLFFIDLPVEAIMDKNNMATIFCPKCSQKMRSFGADAHVVVNG